MKTKLLVLALLAGGSIFAQTRFSVGINLGGGSRGYYTQGPPAYAVAVPPCPGPDYFWTDGYWSQGYGSAWVNGYWARRPYDGGFYQAGPRYNNAYVQRGFNRGYERSENRGFDRGRERNNNNRGRGNEQNYRRGNSYGNGFRGR
jgi:hypothetical protein